MDIKKLCRMCNIEKDIDNFYKGYSECKECNIKRVMKRYNENKNEVLQQRRNKYAHFKDIDNRFKALEKKINCLNI